MAQIVFTTIPSPASTTVQASDGDGEVIGGFDGNDRLYGGAGDTLFFEGVTPWAQPSTAVFTQGRGYDFGQGNDTIVGRGGFDTLSYLNSRVAMRVDLGLGTIRRGAETDVVRNIEKIVFGREDDLAIGTGGGVNLDLAQGDDTLRGVTPHADEVTLAGGAGTDTLDLRDAAPGAVRLRTGMLFLAGEQVGRVGGFEVIYGSATAANDIEGGPVIHGGAGFDTLRGSGFGVQLYGQGGWDELFGSGQLYGGDGHDTITGGGALYGGAGRDDIRGGIGGDTISGGLGGDLILADPLGHTGASFDVVSGGAGGDTIRGGSGNDSLYGGVGDDALDAGAGLDLLDGGDGNDTLTGGAGGGDTLSGGLGNDEIVYAIATAPDTAPRYAALIEGGDGDDRITIAFGAAYGGLDDDVLTATGHQVRLYGGAGDDEVVLQPGLGQAAYGGIGDDLFRLQDGGAVVYGGAGFDTAFVDGGQVRTFSATPGTGAGVVYLSAVNQVIGTDAAVDLRMLNGPVRITLGAGNDSVQSGQSDSRIITGGGDDQVTYTGLRGRIELGEGNNSLSGTTARTLVTSGAGTDEIILTGDRLTIRSGDGDDTLAAGVFGARIEAGAGGDTIVLSGTGDASRPNTARVDGGAGFDRLIIEAEHLGPPGPSSPYPFQLLDFPYQLATGVTVTGVDEIVLQDPDVTGLIDIAVGTSIRLSIPGVTSAADFDSVRSGVFEGSGLSLYQLVRDDGDSLLIFLRYGQYHGDPPPVIEFF